MRILLVQAEANAADRLTDLMVHGRWAVEVAGTGDEGLQLARLGDHDIILLDPDLPDLTGLEVVRGLRSAGVPTPIMLLSNDIDPDGKVRAFAAGADDVAPRTVHPAELLARMSAIVRRAHGHASSVIEVGPLSLDTWRKTVDANGQALKLTRKEYALFELLAMRKGAVVSRGTILDHLYGGLDEPDADIVPVYICRLRRKLTAAGVDDSVLQTAWGRGFTLTAAPARSSHLKKAA